MENFKRAYVLIKANGSSSVDIRKHLASKDFVHSVDLIYGIYDLIAIIEAETNENLSKIILYEIRALSGVEETITLIALQGDY